MRTILTLLILLAVHAASAQRLINNKGNRNQTYPKVEEANSEIKALVDQVSIPNLEASIRWMQEIGIRAAETPAALQTQNWLVDHFEGFGLDVAIHQFPIMGEILDAGNVIAVQYGTEFPDEYIVVSSHYDHQDGPGADDNASGTAGVLEIARILSRQQFKRSIMYIPFNAEEYWMEGSLPFVEKCAEEEMHILGCFNLDMLGFFPENMGSLTMSSGSSYISDRLWEYYHTVANLYVPHIPTFRFTGGDSYGGDNMPFNIYEYPALYIGDTEYHHLHPCYHRPCDTLGHGVNSLELAQGFTRATLAAVVELANGWLPSQNLSAIPIEESIKISWDAVPESVRYRLFKNDELLTETTETSYIDREISEGIEYFYYVTAVHAVTGKESLASNSDSLRFASPLPLPYSNDFEDNFNEWRTSSTWRIEKETENQYITNYERAMSNNYLSIAELQWFSIPATTTDLYLSFSLRYAIHGSWEANNLFLEVTTDRKKWNKIMMKRGTSAWKSYQVSLNDYIGEPFVQIRFRVESSGESSSMSSKNVFLDNVSIIFDYLPQFPSPTNVRIASYNNNRATIQWDRLGNALGYNIFRDGIKINETIITNAEYRDNGAASTDICYQVTAVYEEGESELSEKACIKDFVGMENLVFSGIKIIPNPSTGMINLATGLHHPYRIAVYNIQGIKVHEQENVTDGMLNMSHLPKGVYILKIATAKHALSKKIIIQ